MAYGITGRDFAIVLALGLAACRADGARDLDGLDAAVDPHASPSSDDAFDASSCDPRGLEETLEPSPANIERALDQHCFHSGAGRRALVIDSLCARDKACAVRHASDCRAEYEERWQERQRPNGISVPCADALLDAMSCLAQTSCHDAPSCDAASDRAEVACDPNTPTLGAPMCPPLPEDREPTKGPIPEDAINDAGMLDVSRVPDFVPLLGQGVDEIAGYVRYCGIASGGAVPVYGDDLMTVVGHDIPGRGFVPGDLP